MSKQAKATMVATAKPKGLYFLHPWNAVHRRDCSLIEAYVEGLGDWQTVAEVRPTGHIDVEETANFIVRAVNDYQLNNEFIDELVAALELCLESKGLTWEAEHEADVLIRRAAERAYTQSAVRVK